MPTVSVITPTLNAARWLEDCCRSVDANREVFIGSIEHIIIDDGSQDETIPIAETSNCRIIKGPRRGLYAAINRGIAAAYGDAFVVLGADDVLFPDAVALAVRYLETSGRPMAVGGLRWIDANGSSRGDIAAPPEWLSSRQLAALGWGLTHHQSLYITKDLWSRIGPYDESLHSASDFDLMIRALAMASFARVPRILAAFRRHGMNRSMERASVGRESELVRRRYVDVADPLVRASSWALKVYVNARNPGWAINKLRESVTP